jgi:hypothetical protein
MNRHAPNKRRKGYLHYDDRRNQRYRQSRRRCGTGRARRAGEEPRQEKAASQKKGAPKGRKTGKGGKVEAAAPKKAAKAGAKAGKKSAKPAHKAAAPRAESKGARILDMIARTKGATLVEIMKAADWQAHSVRGFISTAGKKHGVKIESAKNEAGDRTYKIAK